MALRKTTTCEVNLRLEKTDRFLSENEGARGIAANNSATRGRDSVVPEVRQAGKSYQDIFDMIGDTPNLRFRLPGDKGLPVFFKLEGHNPTGSIKDRACASMLRYAVQDGSLVPGKIVLDASSGNFACALAFYSRILGFSSAVAVSSKLTSAKREFLRSLGTEIHEIGDFTIQGNEFCRQLAQSYPSRYCFLDQLHNWRNPRAHFEGTAREILRDFPDIAVVVGSLGSGGAMTGVAQYLKESRPDVKIVTVESASGSRIPGAGAFIDGDYITPFIQHARSKGLFDETVPVTELEAAGSMSLLLDQGIFAGLQTGAVLHATQIYLARCDVTGSVVVLSGDIGWKSLDKLVQLTR